MGWLGGEGGTPSPSNRCVPTLALYTHDAISGGSGEEGGAAAEVPNWF
jgi:hypothetical protein